jgi:hypothetical protein
MPKSVLMPPSTTAPSKLATTSSSPAAAPPELTPQMVERFVRNAYGDSVLAEVRKRASSKDTPEQILGFVPDACRTVFGSHFAAMKQVAETNLRCGDTDPDDAIE